MNRYSDAGGGDTRRVVDFQVVESVEAQAAKWLAVLDADNPPAEKIEEFKQWINQNEAHRQAFESLLSLWDEMNILTQTVPPRRKAQQRKAERQVPIVRSWSGGIAACLALVAVVAVTLVLVVISPPESSVHVTGVGEQKKVELPDGTSVLMNTNSRVEIAYSDGLRGVKLERGEALFQIAKDPQRPFEVYAGGGTIRALGTAFTVHLRDADVEVLVTEGVVEIEKNQPEQVVIDAKSVETTITAPQDTAVLDVAPPQERSLAQVSAGTSAVFGREDFDAVELAQVELLRIEAKLAWRHGVLAFDQEPLENVVKEMARYTSLKLVIPDKALREMKVGGIFKLGDTEAMFEALHQGFDIHTARVSEDLVYLVVADHH